MRNALLLVLLLTGCAAPLTPEERARRHVEYVDKLIDTYGPACEAVGLAKASQQWANCVVRLAQEDEAQSASTRAAWARALQSISDSYGRAAQSYQPAQSTTCQWIGNLWTCR